MTVEIHTSTLPSDTNRYTGWYMLTATKIKNTKDIGDYADGNGLYLRIPKSGIKTWIFRYTFDGTRSAMGLGKLSALSLSDARVKVIELKKLISEGIHPNKPQDSKLSFKETAKAFMNMKRSDWTNIKHAQQWANTLETYAYPFIGNLEVSQITTKHIRDMLSPIWLEKRETATRVRSRVENVIDYAIALGDSDKANPATLNVVKKILPKQPKNIKHFPALAYADVPQFYSSLSNHMSHYGLRMLILTACRTSEVRLAEWTEIDNGVWTIPASKMKAGIEHRVPLSNQLIQMLDGMERLNKYIFPSPSHIAKPLSNIAMLKTTKIINPEITVHGFRSSFKDWCVDNGYDNRLSETALAHVLENKTQAAYERTDLLERRKSLMQDWADYVTSTGQVDTTHEHQLTL